MNILAVGCHPDDLELCCGGTLAKYAARGDKVFMCVVANGNVGHRIISKEELAKIRRQEALASAEIIGAEAIMLGADDLFVRSDDMELREKLVDVIRYTRPDVIITHPQDDYMDDHEETGRLVFEASMPATVNHYPTVHEFYPVLTPIYLVEPVWGVHSLPEEHVDITEFMDIKVKMMSQHQSQLKWLKDHDDIDVIENIKVMSRFRGIQCGVGFAEGFTSLKRFGKQTTRRMLP